MNRKNVFRKITTYVSRVIGKNNFCQDKMLFVDVGAHRGMVADKILKSKPGWILYLLEPNPEEYDFLAEKYKNDDRVKISKNALWNKDGIFPFFVAEYTKSSSMHSEKKNIELKQKIDVECINATRFVRGLKSEFRGYEIILYLNCEGAEFEILDDLFFSGEVKRVKILVQFHHGKNRLNCPERFKKLKESLEKGGVKFVHIWDKTPLLQSVDAVLKM